MKQVKLADLPKSELRVIMVSCKCLQLFERILANQPTVKLEIDLLKNLNVGPSFSVVSGNGALRLILLSIRTL